MSTIILLLLVVFILDINVENEFKISYYKRKMKAHEIEDNVKDVNIFDIIKNTYLKYK